MNKLVASAFAIVLTGAALTAAPAVGEPERKTDLVGIDGQRVDVIPLINDFDATWVVDTQKLLYRDVRQDYYLVTLKQTCSQLSIQGRSFYFHPTQAQLRASSAYEVRPEAGRECNVVRIEKMAEAKALPLRDASLRRVW